MGRMKWVTNGTDAELASLGTTASTQENLKESEEQWAFRQSSTSIENASDAKNASLAKDHKTGFVSHVTTMLKALRHLTLAAYHLITGPLPRLLPDTDDKLLAIRQTLIEFYGLEDRPDVWLTVCGQMASVPISSNRISYKRLATAGHRLTTNAVVKKHKDIEIGKLTARIEEIAKQMAEDETETNGPAMSSETHDLPGDMQTLQGAPS